MLGPRGHLLGPGPGAVAQCAPARPHHPARCGQVRRRSRARRGRRLRRRRRGDLQRRSDAGLRRRGAGGLRPPVRLARHAPCGARDPGPGRSANSAPGCRPWSTPASPSPARCTGATPPSSWRAGPAEPCAGCGSACARTPTAAAPNPACQARVCSPISSTPRPSRSGWRGPRASWPGPTRLGCARSRRRTVESARKRKLSFDKGADLLACEASTTGKPQATLRWITVDPPRLPGFGQAPARRAGGGVGPGRDRRGGGARVPPPPRRGPGRDLRPDRRGGGDLLAAEGPAVPQRRLRRIVEPGAGLVGREADPRRDPRPPAPEASPARDHGLRRLEGRGA